MNEELPFDIQLRRKIFLAKLVGLLTNSNDWDYAIIKVFNLVQELSSVLGVIFPEELLDAFSEVYLFSSLKMASKLAISENCTFRQLKDIFDTSVDELLRKEKAKIISNIEKIDQNEFVKDHVQVIKEMVKDKSSFLKDSLFTFITEYMKSSKSLILKVCGKLVSNDFSKKVVSFTHNNLFEPTSTIDSKSQNLFDDIKTQCGISTQVKNHEEGDDFSSSLKFPVIFSSLPIPTLEKVAQELPSFTPKSIDIIADIPDEIDQLISISPEIPPALFRSKVIPENILDEIVSPDKPNSCVKEFLSTLGQLDKVSNETHDRKSKSTQKIASTSIFDKHDGAEKISWTQDESMLPGNNISEISSIPDDIPFKHIHPPLAKKSKKAIISTEPSSSQQRLISQRIRIPWTPEEDENLIKGFNKFGKNWAIIMNNYSFGPHRTNVSLKDRARVLKL